MKTFLPRFLVLGTALAFGLALGRCAPITPAPELSHVASEIGGMGYQYFHSKTNVYAIAFPDDDLVINANFSRRCWCLDFLVGKKTSKKKSGEAKAEQRKVFNLQMGTKAELFWVRPHEIGVVAEGEVTLAKFDAALNEVESRAAKENNGKVTPELFEKTLVEALKLKEVNR